MEELTDDALGLSFLMNKKKASSDSASICSGRSSLEDKRSDTSSVKSIKIEPSYIDINEHIKPQVQQRYERSQSSESYSDESSEGESSEKSSMSGARQQHYSGRMNDQDIIDAKKELLYQFERLEKKGMKLPRKFTLASNLEEMKLEFERLKRDKEVDSSIKFQRRMTMAAVSGLEFVSGKFDFIGVRLDGWSEKVYDDIEDYDDIFEELHEKYRGKGKMAPELRLMMSLGGSAFMYHMMNRYSNTLPGLDQVLKSNPDLARQLADATQQTQQTQQQTTGSFFSNILGNVFQQQPQQQPPQQQTTRPVAMKGPSNVDDILRELESNNNDRIEVMSAITSSELSELGGDDESSINGLILGGGKKKKKGLSLDI